MLYQHFHGHSKNIVGLPVFEYRLGYILWACSILKTNAWLNPNLIHNQLTNIIREYRNYL